MAVGDRKFRRSTKSPLLPHKHHHQQHRDVFASEVGFSGASFSGAVFNLSTTIVGAGIMALPATLKQLGLIPGLILIALGAILTEFSIDVILRFSKSSKCTSYAGLAGDAFGGVGRTVLQLCVVVNNLGTLVVYLIIIGKSVTLPILVFQFPVNSGAGVWVLVSLVRRRWGDGEFRKICWKKLLGRSIIQFMWVGIQLSCYFL